MLRQLIQNPLETTLVLVLLAVVFLFGLYDITDIGQDLGLHLTLGKMAWQAQQIVATNYFSFTAPDFPWTNNTWLSKVAFYLVQAWVGLRGLIVVKAIVLMAAFVLAFFAFFRKNILVPLVAVGVISAFILIERSSIRPEIFSYLFLGWYLFVLFRKNEKLLWSLPFVQLLWVNSHAYFFLGPVVLGLFILQHFVTCRTLNAAGKRLLVVGGLAVAINIVNPLWLSGAIYPLFIFQNYGISVLENYSPLMLVGLGYSRFSSYAMFLGIILTIVGFWFNRKNIKDNVFGLGMFLVAAALSLIMLRNVAIFGLAMLPINARNFYQMNVRVVSRGWLAGLAVVLVLLAVSVVDGEFYRSSGIERRFGLHVPEGPQKAVDFVRDNHIRGPMFNNYGIGGFLIWKLPEERVFVDSRPEAYPADFFRNIYIGMQEDPQKWKLYTEQYGINLVIYDYFDPNDYSKKFLRDIFRNKDWPLVYQDGWVMVFVKRTPQNEAVVKKYVNTERN